ncbi:transglutaminase domain-containing protein [Clostridium sp. MB40-C1]|uniref:transglutaminase domain-containing protein n=1 Tax=Clostridium sp. MB40-C1 TaxID=3070996 RepID=UPI0027DFE2E7|nr:transglutaminase domain-containing protein [Clostridium sp. MB40-C1]WMJ79094.1 transglutaminase domain-containing protein [Clostridium sp. MB40-C1]
MRENSKGIRIFLILLFAILFFTFEKSFATELTYKIFQGKSNVDISKVWTINFNKKIDAETINNIKVVDKSDSTNIELKFNYDENNNSVKVSTINGYDYGKTYSIIIQDGLKSTDGKKIGQPTKMDFTTSAPQYKVDSYEKFYSAIKYALNNFEDKLEVQIVNYNSKDYKLDTINKIIEENPNIDYGYNGAEASITSYSDGSAKMSINIKYEFSKEEMKNMKELSEKKAKEIINNLINSSMSDYEKELAIHNYIANNSTYDKRVFTNNIPMESYTDYGILIKGTGVCSGYARAMYRLLNMAGVECLYVVGYGLNDSTSVSHAWNMVKIEDEYYHLDVTWDDPITYSGKDIVTYNYFNLTDEKMQLDHSWDTRKYPKCTSTKYTYRGTN